MVTLVCGHVGLSANNSSPHSGPIVSSIIKRKITTQGSHIDFMFFSPPLPDSKGHVCFLDCMTATCAGLSTLVSPHKVVNVVAAFHSHMTV